jgi:MYXO-CTERM domain-containing protein
MCQVTNSTTCTTTPEVCTTDCNATTGGVIVCNGQVVDAETSFADATAWYVSHLDATFMVSAMASGSVGGGGTSSTTAKCSVVSPGSGSTGAGGLLLGGFSLAAIGLLRRRNRSL